MQGLGRDFETRSWGRDFQTRSWGRDFRGVIMGETAAVGETAAGGGGAQSISKMFLVGGGSLTAACDRQVAILRET